MFGAKVTGLLRRDPTEVVVLCSALLLPAEENAAMAAAAAAGLGPAPERRTVDR